MQATTLYGRGIWNVKIWIALGFGFILLNSLVNSAPKSTYWFSEFLLYGLMLIGLWANRRHDLRKKIAIPRRLAPLAYIFLFWLFGMLYETSLTVNGTGIGGMHQETLPSFILAQGSYIPLAILSYLVIRKLRIAFPVVFFFAAGVSLAEGLIFTGVLTSVILSPLFFLAPITLAYYALAYSSFIALPLLFIDEELLWQDREQKPQHSMPYYWFLGFILTFAIVNMFWGLVYSPIVTQLLRLPANILGN